jgi:hypothetical protein
MSSQQQALLVVTSAIVSAGYMAPTLIGVVRHGTGVWRILTVNALLGWTVLGWLWAMKLAFAAPAKQNLLASDWTPWSPGRPEAACAQPPNDATYEDGSYLISEAYGARTWAVCSGGRWGVAYELDGLQRTSSWIDTCDVPLEVLARALASRHRPEKRT